MTVNSANDVFISYSRKDQLFVRTLDAAFRKLDQNPWVDWEDIAKGEEWWKAIQRGIDGAHTLVFVLSPDSVASTVCREEIEYAAQHNKRFLPIVRREGFDMEQVHPKISSHNWLFFRETDEFDAAFQELQTAIATDLDYVRAHTRLLVRAVEWQANAEDPSYLLRGNDLTEAEQWCVQGAAQPTQPTALHTQYIQAGLDARTQRQRSHRRSRRTIVLSTLVTNLVLAIAGGAWFYHERINNTLQRIEHDMVRALHMGTLGINGDEFAQFAQQPGGQKSLSTNDQRLYQAHQIWLSAIRTVFPDTWIRTYIQGSNQQGLWVGDVSRNIAKAKKKTRFLEPFQAATWQWDLLQGKNTVLNSSLWNEDTPLFNRNETVLMTPHARGDGTSVQVVSASQPIKNTAGKIVGVITVDYTEDYLTKEKQKVIQTLFWAYLVIFLWLLILSWILVRATRPVDES